MNPAVLLLVPILGIGSGTDKDDRDVVELASGKQLRGRIVLATDAHVILRIGSRERRVARDKIKRYTSVFETQGEVLRSLRRLDKETPEALITLADFCKEHALPHTERLLLWRILLIDASHDVAHERLGHQKRKGEWRIPGRGGALTMERAAKVRSDWGKAWELRSEHYAVRCSAGLRSTVLTLFDLEFFYHYLLAIFQGELGLREVIEPMQAYLYRDQRQFPRIGTHAGAYFSPAENILFTYVGDPRARPYGLFHEATHSLLYNTTTGASRSRGRLPPWLDEAWAEYMQCVVTGGRAGCPDHAPARLATRHVHTLLRAKRPYKVHRILNFEVDDYHASSKQGLKYSQGCVLFHYLLHGEDGAFRREFLDYLREAVSGKGQASTFRRIFRRHLDRIERGHIAYARSR